MVHREQATPFLTQELLPFFYFCSFGIMGFSGKYELESQENYEDFLEAVGMRILFFFKPQMN